MGVRESASPDLAWVIPMALGLIGLGLVHMMVVPAQRPLALGAVLALGTFATTTMLLDLFGTRRCPGCGASTLRRVRRIRVPLRYAGVQRFFCCSTCRARWKRRGDGSWLAASGPSDPRYFESTSNAGRWQGAERPQPDGSTCGMLLKQKRLGHLGPVDPGPPPRSTVVPAPPIAVGPDEGPLSRLLARKRSLRNRGRGDETGG